MKDKFSECLEHILNYEGGFSDDPEDPGGATNKGITLTTLREVYPSATREDLKNISDRTVKDIYKKKYWDVCRCEHLPDGLDLVVFDCAVNSGTRQAALWLQRCVGVAADGVIGPMTLGAANAKPIIHCINWILDIRLMFLSNLNSWAYFGAGWHNRIIDVRVNAILMAFKNLLDEN
jgi:lysozyme family protein